MAQSALLRLHSIYHSWLISCFNNQYHYEVPQRLIVVPHVILGESFSLCQFQISFRLEGSHKVNLQDADCDMSSGLLRAL